jgi:hypothetical protein
MTARQHKVHTQLGRAAAEIFAANEPMNQVPSNIAKRRAMLRNDLVSMPNSRFSSWRRTFVAGEVNKVKSLTCVFILLLFLFSL